MGDIFTGGMETFAGGGVVVAIGAGAVVVASSVTASAATPPEMFTGKAIPPEGATTLALDGRQSVLTEQFVQSKFIMPVLVPLAVPVKTPLAFIITPLKSLQPIFSPQAEPDNVPSLLLATPEVLGFKLIQPYISFQA